MGRLVRPAPSLEREPRSAPPTPNARPAPAATPTKGAPTLHLEWAPAGHLDYWVLVTWVLVTRILITGITAAVWILCVFHGFYDFPVAVGWPGTRLQLTALC